MDVMNITIDPTDSFKGIKDKKLLASCGLILDFAEMVRYQQPETAQQAFDMLMDVYGYGSGDGSGWGTVDAEGAYRSEYEEDSDLPPIVTLKLGEGIDLNVYQYGIVSVVDKETTLITRMD